MTLRHRALAHQELLATANDGRYHPDAQAADLAGHRAAGVMA